ncbi:hypothetical protein F400_gp002 [Bacillus phage BCD7]|uniref:Uncharacterized protein n=1 Tax=Bacillus phage BCD7 TaxID=1136534 RepID=J9PV49_9CAUD|nr:hypothetical protein F400_gp002 [Bacillus phage BCD7]AEZ50449.1 hypothetical protein BCD7_0002 [Bacillus phage BCD7]
MKKVQWLSNMIAKAKAEGEAYKKKNGYVVFSIEILDGNLTVYREGTLILDANIHSKVVQNNSGGYSRTDAQYINHIMWEFGMYHPQLRYAHTRNHYENGMTLVNLFPKKLVTVADYHMKELHYHISDLVGQIYGQKVSSIYNYDKREFQIVREDGILLYSQNYEDGFKFTNEKGKEDTYKNYFTGEDLTSIAMKYYYDSVMELVKTEYFDIHHKQVVQ